MVDVRLASDWIDPEGREHHAGEFVGVDPVTLAELEASGVVDDDPGHPDVHHDYDLYDPATYDPATVPGDYADPATYDTEDYPGHDHAGDHAHDTGWAGPG